jgi:hypothetical protein
MTNCIAFSVCLVLVQMATASAGSIRTRMTAEVGGKGVPKLTNFQRISRNAVATRKQEFQSESRAEQADVTITTFASTISTTEDVPEMKPDAVVEAESTTMSTPAAEITTDVALPLWDSAKIETSKTMKDDSAASDEDDSFQKSKSEFPSFVDRKKEAERLRKVLSAFHLNRVLGTTAPTPEFRGFPITPAPSTRQRALGFPLLITNTLDNFHHQLDWSRFGSFSAELE